MSIYKLYILQNIYVFVKYRLTVGWDCHSGLTRKFESLAARAAQPRLTIMVRPAVRGAAGNSCLGAAGRDSTQASSQAMPDGEPGKVDS